MTEGEITIVGFPQQHADHFHVGEAVVMGKDATGIFNQSVWNALTRKGVARADWPNTITLTKGSILGSNSTIEVQIESQEIIL